MLKMRIIIDFEYNYNFPNRKELKETKLPKHVISKLIRNVYMDT